MLQYKIQGLTKHTCNKMVVDLYVMERFIIPSIRFAFEHAWLHCRDDFKSLVIMIYDSEVLLHFCALKLLSLHEVGLVITEILPTKMHNFTFSCINLFASTPVAATGYAFPKRTLPCEHIIVHKNAC